jgi:hypothetical protein
MSPLKLFASIREHRRCLAQQSYEEGAQIARRVLDLLAVPTPTQEVETPSTKARSDNEPSLCCDGRPHSSFSEQGSYAGYPASDRREV